MQPRVISATLLVKIHHQCSCTFDTHLFGPSESLAAWLVWFPLPHPTIETAWRNLVHSIVFVKNWSTEGPFSVLLAHFQSFFSVNDPIDLRCHEVSMTHRLHTLWSWPRVTLSIVLNNLPTQRPRTLWCQPFGTLLKRWSRHLCHSACRCARSCEIRPGS